MTRILGQQHDKGMQWVASGISLVAKATVAAMSCHRDHEPIQEAGAQLLAKCMGDSWMMRWTDPMHYLPPVMAVSGAGGEGALRAALQRFPGSEAIEHAAFRCRVASCWL